MKNAIVYTLAAALLALLHQSALASDHFLTVGGGYSPRGNQISLEKNVQLFQRLLGQEYGEGAPHHILFSDGNHAGPDIQYMDPEFKIPRHVELLARVFRQTKYLKYQYRTHQIENVQGVSSHDNLKKWFEEVGAKLKAGDRLFIYATAHGGRGPDRKQPQNTVLYLWRNQRISMKDFTALLDKVPSEVPVVTVMVQCYAGGFANLTFEGGDPKSGAAQPQRCGFFATVHNRVAAGCTPDINEANYQEYSSYFWAALQGKTRTGQPIDSCDYDGDGRTSFAEAHAYALLTSGSIDVSIKTSDTFLRAFSATTAKKPAKKGDGKKDDAKKDDAKKDDAKKDDAKKDDAKKDDAKKDDAAEKAADDSVEQPVAAEPKPLLTVNTSYDELFALAHPVDKAVLDGLSVQLELKESERGKEAKKLADDLMKQKKAVESTQGKLNREYGSITKQINESLLFRWPQLNNRWHPESIALVADEGDTIIKAIESHARYKRFEELSAELQQISAKRLDFDKRWAKCQRLIRALENVALAANLPQLSDEKRVAEYEQLIASENGFFGPKK
ncbi:MAG: hypothetical protein QF805_21255 [Pirellulaceae bacterium]|nr:hypothetical protein [Pirellulaceae bacterium]